MSKNSDAIVAELRALIEKSKGEKLSQPDEQRGAQLFRDLIQAGGKAQVAAFELLTDLPWFVPVSGTVEAWPGISPARKKTFLAALRQLTSEAGRRARLSIARGLYKVDPDAAFKVLSGTLGEMRQNSGLEPKDRQIVFNVLVGKNKPWLLQLDLATIKPAEAKLFAQVALECAGFASPPSAINLIQWAKPYATLSDLSEPAQSELAKTFRKWSSRWRKQLSEEPLPSPIAEAVQVREPVQTNREAPTHHPSPGTPTEERHSAKGALRNEPEQHIAKPHVRKKSVDQRPHREKNHQIRKVDPSSATRAGSDIPELLGQLEVQFHQLKSELQTVKDQLKQNHPRKAEAPIPPSKEVDKLRQDNQRLAGMIEELRTTLRDLTEKDFEHAVSRRADTETPVTDPLEQFKSLLSLRLRDQITNFQAINRERHIDALPVLLENLLTTLEQHGIDLSSIEEVPAPARKRF
jgi:hypothetical protein